MNGRDGFWRNVIIRYPQNESGITIPTSEETRSAGLQVLKRFFCDETYSQYPLQPEQITVVDESDDENPPSLDMYFTDQQIRTFMLNHIEDKDLNNNFVNEYASVARFVWGGQNVSDWARTLGFPVEPNNDNNDD